MTPNELDKLKEAIISWLNYSGWFIMSATVWLIGIAAKANNNIPEKCRDGAGGYCFDDFYGAFNWHMFTHYGLGIAAIVILIPTIAYIVNRTVLVGRERTGLTPESRRRREREQAAQLHAAQARTRELEDYCGLEHLDAVPRGMLKSHS